MGPSGSTESNNLAIKGVADMYARKGRHIITAVHEHKAILDPCKRLQKEGCDVTWLEPNEQGIITADMVAGALRDDTVLVTIMWANNEIGTINEVPEIGNMLRERYSERDKPIFHTDATQWVGKMPTDVQRDGIDLLRRLGTQDVRPQGRGLPLRPAGVSPGSG